MYILVVAVSKWNAARILFIIFKSQISDIVHEKFAKLTKCIYLSLTSIKGR